MIMRRVLVNHAKQRKRLKRGDGVVHLTLGQADAAVPETPDIDVEALDEALTRLADFDPRAARVVECRYFGGLKIEETAEVLNISPATVKRSWLSAKTWLRREIKHPG
jgi:RNA polymerase sigma factor (TIGR02999 family)